MSKVQEFGGAAKAIEVGFQKNEIETTAYDYALQIDKGERTIVGVNKFAIDVEEKYEPLRVDPAIGEQQTARLQAIRANRNNAEVTRALDALKRAAQSSENVMYPMKEALAAQASGGEVADALREVWGSYNPPEIF
jgi:methylmalonyl-CoA mutase N-terminal domain/subunit